MSIRLLSSRILGLRACGASLSSYKSSLALENLYPQSTCNIAKTPNIPQNGAATFSGYIPMDKLKISCHKSSGPGGQNVNVLNTKVDIRFHLDSADWIPETVRENMKLKLRNGLTKEGYIFITSDRTRTQHMNIADALEKLREMIRSCEPIELAEPSPETVDMIRKRQEKAARARLRQKRERQNTKSSRGASGYDV